MKTTIKTFLGIVALIFISGSCTEKQYSMGDMTAPTNIAVTAEIVGQDAEHPDGDGSGAVNLSFSADNAISYKVDYDASDGLNYVLVPDKVTKKFTKAGLNTYTVTVMALGKGGASSYTATTLDVTVRSDFKPDPAMVTNLTNDASKVWVVDKSVAGHFGVGPIGTDWDGSLYVWPNWWAGAVNEKLSCCPCMYTTTFTFTKVSDVAFSLTVASPDGAFTKTGDLAGGLPGIPASGDEGCYSYPGGTSSFSFIPASSGIPALPANPSDSPSTQVSLMLDGVNTFIGYGAVLKEYEILVLTSDYMYLRVQGTETANAWYLKFVPAGK